jgi:hypothetical protein
MGNRAELDSAAGINSVERSLGDEALRRGWKVPVDAAPTGKRVLVVGAGSFGRLPSHPPGSLVAIKDTGCRTRRHDAPRHPKYLLPRDIPDTHVNASWT